MVAWFRWGFSLVNVGGNSDNVSNGNAGPSYAICNNLSNSNANNGARLTNLHLKSIIAH